jgi:hypothetical protein
MKNKYKIFIGVFIVLAISFVVWLGYFTDNKELPVDQLIQGISIFVAIIAVVVALSASDPKPRKVNVKLNTSVDKEPRRQYQKQELSDMLKTKYENQPEVFHAYTVRIKVLNISGFDFVKPILTFELPLEMEHPEISEPPILWSVFHTNLYNSGEQMQRFWNDEKILISNSNFPFWNTGREYEIWFEMVIDEVNYTPFEVILSINCNNAAGISKKIAINPADFLKD